MAKVGETTTGYKLVDGVEISYEYIWTQEDEDKHNESYDLRWIKMTNEIRVHLQNEIDKLIKYEKPQREADEMWVLYVGIDEIKETINSYEVVYGGYVQGVVLTNNIDVEVYRSSGKPFKYIDPRTGMKLKEIKRSQ